MKTLAAPDTLAAAVNAARDFATANPAAAFVLCVALTAAWAAWAARNI